MRHFQWKQLLARFEEIGAAWGRYECSSLAAGIAFYAALSIFPLTLVLLAGVGVFFRFVEKGRDAGEQIQETIAQQLSPQVAESLSQVLSQIQDRALVNGPLAFLMLLFGATLVFFQIDRAFYRIWDVRQRVEDRGLWAAAKRILVSRALSLVWVVGCCLLVVLVFVAGLVLRTGVSFAKEWFPDISLLTGVLTVAVGMVINLLVFFLLYFFVSKEKVDWRVCLKAGALATVLWECGGRLLSAVSFGSNFSAYGLVGSFLVVLLWIYYNVMILLLGAVIVRLETEPSGDFRDKI